MPPNFATSALYALDNLDVMRGMDSETVHLIYADPPFNSKRIYQGMAGTKAAGHRFRDTWSWNDAKEEWRDQIANDWPAIGHLVEAAKAHSGGMAGYLAFMAVRVIEIQRILRPDGSLYLHCDPTASSYLRMLLDIVFGSGVDNRTGFRSLISWNRHSSNQRGSQHQPRSWGATQDIILHYANPDAYVAPYRDLTEEESKKQFPHIDEQNKHFYDDSAHIWRTPNMGARPNLCYTWEKEGHSFTNPHPSGWRLGKDRMEEEYAKGNIVILPNGKLQRRKYEKDYPGKPIGSLWEYMPQSDNERTGWQTQKPLALLERIIKASSNEGDIVFDPFCGCGTALVAAEQLGRQWVGADDDANAVAVIRERIANLTGTIDDAPQMQHGVSVITDPPERTATETGTVYKDPTGYIVPKMPSDRMTNEQIRQQLIDWQTEQDGLITCPGCAERLKPRHFHCDHINPKSAGGVNRIDNRIMLCGACNGDKSNDKAMPALWSEHGVRGKERQRMRGLLAETQSKARALVQQMDAGAPVQGTL